MDSGGIYRPAGVGGFRRMSTECPGSECRDRPSVTRPGGALAPATLPRTTKENEAKDRDED